MTAGRSLSCSNAFGHPSILNLSTFHVPYSLSLCFALVVARLVMVSAVNSTAYPFQSALFGVDAIPVHHWIGADVGNAFYWEQRYWVAYLRLTDGSEYRKREKRQGYVEKLQDSLNMDSPRVLHILGAWDRGPGAPGPWGPEPPEASSTLNVEIES